MAILGLSKDIVRISHVTYRKLDELKCSTQPVKMIRMLDPFETINNRCEDIETPPWASKRCVSNNSYFERDVSKPKINQ